MLGSFSFSEYVYWIYLELIKIPACRTWKTITALVVWYLTYIFYFYCYKKNNASPLLNKTKAEVFANFLLFCLLGALRMRKSLESYI